MKSNRTKNKLQSPSSLAIVSLRDGYLPRLYQSTDDIYQWYAKQPEMEPVLSGEQSFADLGNEIAWVVPLY